MRYRLDGIWDVVLADGTAWQMKLPGTLDESGIGYKDCGANQWHPDAALGNAAGEVDKDAPIATRFTRRHTYEGEAGISRRIVIDDYGNERLFVKAERARALKLLVDGRECRVFSQGTLSTPYIYELTGVEPGEHELTFVSDNSYPGMPKEAICYSSAATDETQTNWNGIIGEIIIYTRPRNFISGVYVYPKKLEGTETGKNQEDRGFCLDVCVEVAAKTADEICGHIVLSSEALCEEAVMDIPVHEGAYASEDEGNPEAGQKLKQGAGRIRMLWIRGLKVKEDVRLWDEEEGNLYGMTAELYLDGGKAPDVKGDVKGGSRIEDFDKAACADMQTVSFGIRSFDDDGNGRLAINGRSIFLRSEANCAEFPETGHAPMSVEAWREILLRYRSYGINCVRFHSHCAPEAAFIAADELGMLLQPELSNWNPRDAFETDESYEYYSAELQGIIRTLANHPSFVMLTLGNELQTKEKGRERMRRLVALARELDATRLYANGSNAFYGEEGCDADSDFYTSQSCHEVVIRGTFSGMRGYINEKYPSADHDYDAAMQSIREQYKKPVFSFEVGQFEVLPDFDELSEFKGISEPVNLQIIKKRVEERGLLGDWKEYVEATGELSRLAYREEIEAAMRTRALSGISLLGLQDFPGQGTALVGMMNSHLEPKPFSFAKPKRFREFFKESMPLVKLPRYTYEAGERLVAKVDVANFGKKDIEGEVRFGIRYRNCAVNCGGRTYENAGSHGSADDGQGFILSGGLGYALCRRGTHTEVGTIDIPLDFTSESAALELMVRIGDCGSTYPLWVYKKVAPVCPENVYETRVFDERTKEILRAGGRVYLSPDATKESLPASIKTQFTTDFWSVGTFAEQEGGMGQLIDVKHPIFRDFPTDKHTDWQWWLMAGKRAVILPRTMKSIVTEMDSYAFLRPMAQLMEFKCMGGRVLLSTMELHKCQQYPEARALLDAIYKYMSGDEFAPQEELGEGEIAI